MKRPFEADPADEAVQRPSKSVTVDPDADAHSDSDTDDMTGTNDGGRQFSGGGMCATGESSSSSTFRGSINGTHGGGSGSNGPTLGGSSTKAGGIFPCPFCPKSYKSL